MAHIVRAASWAGSEPRVRDPTGLNASDGF